MVLTCELVGVERVERERMQRLRVGLLPQFGSGRHVPQKEGTRRVQSDEKMTTGVLLAQPLHVCNRLPSCDTCLEINLNDFLIILFSSI